MLGSTLTMPIFIKMGPVPLRGQDEKNWAAPSLQSSISTMQQQPTCAVCLGSLPATMKKLAKNKKYTTLDCGHVYHTACAGKCPTCPRCKSNTSVCLPDPPIVVPRDEDFDDLPELMDSDSDDDDDDDIVLSMMISRQRAIPARASRRDSVHVIALHRET